MKVVTNKLFIIYSLNYRCKNRHFIKIKSKFAKFIIVVLLITLKIHTIYPRFVRSDSARCLIFSFGTHIQHNLIIHINTLNPLMVANLKAVCNCDTIFFEFIFIAPSLLNCVSISLVIMSKYNA